MNDFESAHLPEDYRPLSPWAYFGLELLYALPLVGWIFLICHAIGSRNCNKRNFARSYFVVWILIGALILAASLLGVTQALSDSIAQAVASLH